MALDPLFTYYAIGKATAQKLTFEQAQAIPGMELIAECLDFSGYSGPPDWSMPDFWIYEDAFFGPPGNKYPPPTPDTVDFYDGSEEYEMGSLLTQTKYTGPGGQWLDASDLGGAEPQDSTGLFLVALRGPGAELFTPSSTYGTDDLSINYGVSNTDGGQYINIIAYGAPFFRALVTQWRLYAVFDGEPPPEPEAFWTNFVGAYEVQ